MSYYVNTINILLQIMSWITPLIVIAHASLYKLASLHARQ